MSNTQHFYDDFVDHDHTIRRDKLTSGLEWSGFAHSTWLPPEQTGFFQPIVVAYKQ